MEVCTNLDRKVTRLTAEADRNGNCLEYDLLLKKGRSVWWILWTRRKRTGFCQMIP